MKKRGERRWATSRASSARSAGRPGPRSRSPPARSVGGRSRPSTTSTRCGATFTREAIAGRPRDLWRYAELLPLDGEPTVGRGTGFTPLLAAPRAWAPPSASATSGSNTTPPAIPTLSFKDRLVAVALSKAKEFGLDTVGCASTGNLANAVAAGAAAAGLRAVVLVPVDLEAAKLTATAVYGATLIGVRGNYDRVNRLCTEIADRFGWGLVNVNLRAYYSEGSKTVGFELAEQGGWQLPRHVVCPMAGASLINKVDRAFHQLTELGLVEGRPYSLHGAQAAGCAPVVRAWKENLDRLPLVKPSTIVRSLAIGDPADGLAAVATIKRTGGRAEDATDPEVLECMRLLAQTEGLFAETAGGTVVAAARQAGPGGRLRRRRARGPAPHRPRPEDGRGALGEAAVQRGDRRAPRRVRGVLGRARPGGRAGARAGLMRNVQVHKFGGASLADAPAFAHAVRIVGQQTGKLRGGGVGHVGHDRPPPRGRGEGARRRSQAAGRHRGPPAQEARRGARACWSRPAPSWTRILSVIDASMTELATLAQGIAIVRELTPRTKDELVARGERLSAHLFSAALHATGQRLRLRGRAAAHPHGRAVRQRRARPRRRRTRPRGA